MSTQGKPPPTFGDSDPRFDEELPTPVSNRPHRDAVRPPADNLTPIDLSLPPIPMSPLKRQQVFGRFAWSPDPIPGNAERIRIVGDWVAKNVVSVKIPQLEKLGIWPAVRFHRLGVNQLLSMWAAWEEAGLLDRVKTWNGSFATRFKRGKAGSARIEDLSNHAWATAIDINVAWNRLGDEPAELGKPGCVRELVPIAHRHGFVWGGHFLSRKDGMHWELGRLQP